MSELPNNPGHTQIPDCPCNPMLWEICPVCDPFQEVDSVDDLHEQMRMAMAVRVSMRGVRAQRPKRSRKPVECWYCGGYGINLRTLDEVRELGEKCGVVSIVHRTPKKPEQAVEG